MTRTDQMTLAVGMVGAVAVTVGVALFHPAAGWIAGGAFALAWSWLQARSAARAGQEGG